MQVNRVRSRESRATRAATLLLCSLMLCVGASAQAEVATRVFLNGSVTPVYFNDGDSFRVLAGPLKGTA